MLKGLPVELDELGPLIEFEGFKVPDVIPDFALENVLLVPLVAVPVEADLLVPFDPLRDIEPLLLGSVRDTEGFVDNPLCEPPPE